VDRTAAKRRGETAGGDVLIRGLPAGLGWIGRLHRHVDWTAGCIAVTDEEIDEIGRAVRDGTIVEIRR
jgi:murein L,D-transpeptidase YafK